MLGKKYLLAVSFLASAMGALAASTSDIIVGSALGGAAGAVIGNSVGGRDGAVVGGALGAGVGVALANQQGRDERGYRYDRHDRRYDNGYRHYYGKPVKYRHKHWRKYRHHD